MRANTVVRLNSSSALIQQAKLERQRLIEQIQENQKTIERSREIICRLDEVLSREDR
jgi:hypothetical protein